MTWMIYGANGYTGKMAVERAIAYGQRPVLALQTGESEKAYCAS